MVTLKQIWISKDCCKSKEMSCHKTVLFIYMSLLMVKMPSTIDSGAIHFTGSFFAFFML